MSQNDYYLNIKIKRSRLVNVTFALTAAHSNMLGSGVPANQGMMLDLRLLITQFRNELDEMLKPKKVEEATPDRIRSIYGRPGVPLIEYKA